MKKITTKIILFTMGILSFSAISMTKEEACEYFSWQNQTSCKEVAYGYDLTPKQIEACSGYWAKTEIQCMEIAHILKLTPKQIDIFADSREENQIPLLEKLHNKDLEPEQARACGKFYKDNHTSCFKEAHRLTSGQLNACQKLKKEEQMTCVYIVIDRNLTPKQIEDCLVEGWIVDPISCLKGMTWWDVLKEF